MHKSISRAAVALGAAAALSALGLTGASPSGAASSAPQRMQALSAGLSGAAALPGTQLWLKRYTGPDSGWDSNDGATSVAVSRSGRTVFVAGYSWRATSGLDSTTMAYSAATGAQLWLKRYTGPGGGTDSAVSVAISPRGDTVFITGVSTRAASGGDYITVAYNAATGGQRWVKRYTSPGDHDDQAESVTVSPNGRTVFVTGYSWAITGSDYATVAYHAATGTQLWVSRYNGPGNGLDAARSMAISPNGHAVFVTGGSYGTNAGSDSATVAYNAATGTQLWVSRYNGPGNGLDGATSMAISPNGHAVFVTGGSYGTNAGSDSATVAYNAATGTQLWVSRYNGPANRDDYGASVAISPNGQAVFVTGNSTGTTWGGDYATLAYDAATGTQLWVSRYNGPGNYMDWPSKVAVSPTGRRIYVTGFSYGGVTSEVDYATVSYNAATGVRQWVKRYNGPGNGWDIARSLAVSPNGRRVFVTGQSFDEYPTFTDWATIAYSG